MKRGFISDVGGKFTIPLKQDGKTVATLLWGDPVKIQGSKGRQYKVCAREREGWIPKSAVSNEGLLELYIIDVGQGDGVLMRTPDDAWHLIDAGVSNDQQMTKKGAANFVYWKFFKDLGEDAIRLANIIVTHSDFDHYGGLLDLFSGKLSRPDREFRLEVENFYHCGMGRFAAAPALGKIEPGKAATLPYPDYGVKDGGQFIVELLSGKTSFSKPARPFDSGRNRFAQFARFVGKVPKRVRRISNQDKYLPGYEEGSGEVTIRVLGPILEEISGNREGLRYLQGASKTRNGHSIVLRVDYGKARLLLTGDSNTLSQRLLLTYCDPREFAADVAKGCHHGSDDIDLQFVKAMQARATVISSGDNETYAHPRPRVLGASARYGREAKEAKGGRLLPPLLYSTELARSVTLKYPAQVREIADTDNSLAAEQAEIATEGEEDDFRALASVPISTNLVYGLINVRTDGERVLCGYMKEGGSDFDIKIFRAGIEP